MHVFAALARTKGDINYPSWEKLDHLLSVPFPHKSWLQGYWKNSAIVHFHFQSRSLKLAAKYSITIDTQKKQIKHRLNYMLMSNKSSPGYFLANDECSNPHVKMDKKTP